MPLTDRQAREVLDDYINNYEPSNCSEVYELTEGLDSEDRERIADQCAVYTNDQEQAFDRAALQLMPLVKAESRPALAKLIDIVWENAELPDFRPYTDEAVEYIVDNIKGVSYSSGGDSPLPGPLGQYGRSISWEGIQRAEGDRRSLRDRYLRVYGWN